MITVFNGKSFGLSGEKSSGFVQVDRTLVDHIASFTPSGFAVVLEFIINIGTPLCLTPSLPGKTDNK